MIMQDPVSAINIPDYREDPTTFLGPGLEADHKSDIYINHATSAAYNVLAVFASNSIEIPAVIWGTHYCGGTVFPMNPAYTAKELTRQLLLSKTKAICTQRNFLPTVREAALEAGPGAGSGVLGLFKWNYWNA
ncbi:unnamed protein product [Aureobasidium pullulans]|nr:unnamed protein product [Aureobasidium pullulans]